MTRGTAWTSVAAGISGLLGFALARVLIPQTQLAFPVGAGALVVHRPLGLALLAVAPLLIALALFSQRGTTQTRRLLALLLRLLWTVALALALARAGWERSTRSVRVVALVDESASVSPRQRASQEAFLSRLRQTARGQDLHVLRFSGDGGSRETNLASAVGRGLGLAAGDRSTRLVMLSDGRATRGDVLALAATATARGASISFVPMPPLPEDNVGVIDLSAPADVAQRAPFELQARLFSHRRERVRATFTRDGHAEGPDATRDLDLDAGVTTLRWTTRVESAATTLFEVALTGATGAKDDDRARLAVRARPRSVVWIVDGVPGAGAALARALAAEALTVERHPLSDLGRGLAPPDLVVLAEVPAAGIGRASADALASFVKDGGGVLVAGGPDAFDVRGAPEAWAQLLPAHHRPEAVREEASLALALVIDRSGSMSGPKMDLTKEAARGTAQMLAPEDLIAVILFDSQAHPLVRLQPAANRQRILNDLSQIRASGGTNLLPALREAVLELGPARARKKHVIVLSDGQSPSEGILDVVDEAVAARVTLSSVAVGDGADQALLARIAERGGGRFYQTKDPSSLPKIFTRETAEVSVRGPSRVGVRLRPRKAAQLLTGIDLTRAPALGGHARVDARPGAEVVATTDDGEPILLRWPRGLGQVTAWGSGLGGRWADDFARWPQYPKLWAQTARATMRRGRARWFPIHADLVPGGARLRLNAWLEEDQPLTGAGVLVVARDAGARQVASVPLREVRPGQYEGLLAVSAGPLLLEATVLDDARQVVAGGGAHLALPPDPERLPDGVLDPGGGGAVLRALAAATGGAPIASPSDLLATAPGRHVKDLRLGCLLIALALFLADVAVRRVRLPAS